MDAKKIATLVVAGTVVALAAGVSLAPAGGSEQQVPSTTTEARPTTTTTAALPPRVRAQLPTRHPETLQELVDLLASNLASMCRVERPASVRVYTGITREAAELAEGGLPLPNARSQNVIVLVFEGEYTYYAARGPGSGPPPTGTITITADAETLEATDLAVSPRPLDLSSLGPGEMIATT